MLFLEEELAVGLMFRLLFIPLFHDSSFVGRIVSFFFRIFRIFIGLFAIVFATTLIVILALIWLMLPLIALAGTFGVWAWIVLFLLMTAVLK